MARKRHSLRIAFWSGSLILVVGAWLAGLPVARAQFVCDSTTPGGAAGAGATGNSSMACGTNATADGENATAVGSESDAIGLGSTAIGAFAGSGAAVTNSSNTAIGNAAGTIVDGTQNTAIGAASGGGVTGDNNTATGTQGPL